MARRKLSDAERWQSDRMIRGGISYRQAAERFIIIQCVNHTGCGKERQRTGRLPKTSTREDKLFTRFAMQQPFSTANTLRSRWIVNGHISRQTVNRRLNNARYHAWRSIKHSLLSKRHKTSRFKWPRDHMGWNVRSRQRVHWSDESNCLLNPVDGRVRVSRPRNTAFRQEHVVGTTAFGGGGVTVW